MSPKIQTCKMDATEGVSVPNFDLLSFLSENSTDMTEISADTIDYDQLNNLISNVQPEIQTEVQENSENLALADEKSCAEENRFEDITDEQINQIASATAAKATHKQTKWAINIFTGKYSHK